MIVVQGQSPLVYGLASAHGLGPRGEKGSWSYVYSGKTVFAGEKASTRNDEAYDMLVVSFDDKSKTAKTTRPISTT